MAVRTRTSEGMVDLQGAPLNRDAALFLETIDRLLTVSSYYSHDHHQYHQAVAKACAQIRKAIGHRSHLAVEITATGVMVLDQELDPNQLHVRKLFDLLVPLNLARLEFQAILVPGDLRRALAALKDARIQLETGDGFREVVVHGLPETVSIATRHVVNEPAGSLLDDVLLEVENEGPSIDAVDPQSEGESLARVFMELAENLLANLEDSLHLALGTGEGRHKTAVTREELRAIREGLKRMVQMRPDPQELLHLIDHAKTAVELSGNAESVDLAFKILRDKMGGDDRPAPRTRRLTLREDFSFSTGALLAAVNELSATGETWEEPELSSSREQLSIAVSLLGGNDDGADKTRAWELLECGLTTDLYGKEHLMRLLPLVFHLARLNQRDDEDSPDQGLTMFFQTVRKSRARMVPDLWCQILEYGKDDAHHALWPHLINDLVLGFGADAGHIATTLWDRVGQLGMGCARKSLPCLKKLPAFSSTAGEPDLGPLWSLPLAQTRPAHAVLMNSRFANRHGILLLRAMKRQPFNDLTRIMAMALDEYRPHHRKFIFALVCEGDLEKPSPRLGQMAGELLADRLLHLPRENRKESWVIEAIAMLPALLGGKASPVLDRIRRERRYLVMRAWPANCRRTAAAYLERG